MSKKLLTAIFAALFIFNAFPLFSQASSKKGVVILVAQNQNTYDKLDVNDKLYARSAFQTFVGNLTLLDDITVRTDANDTSLRQVQKQSQIDASKGLGSEDSTYALDQASKASLRIEISLVKYKSGYKLEYSASNIETMQIVSSASSDSYFELEDIDIQTDLLSYSCLKSLYGKGYISEVPYNVEMQLTHSSDSSENYAKYILELTKQIEDCQKELDGIKKNNLSAAEKAEATRKEQALQLKIQAAESAKRKTEENLRRYQEEMAKKEKQEAELRALTEQKRNDLAKKFQDKIKQSQEQQSKLNKELSQSLSLEKRIELIEADRNSMAELENSLLAQVEINRDDFTRKMEEEIDAIYSEPWRLAEKDANGNPTAKAQKYRDSQAKKVEEKYAKLIEESNSELKSAFSPAINTYQKQIDEGIKDIEATTFVYRSFETGSQLSVSVGNYDGEKCNWKVVPEFTMKETDLISNIPDLTVFQCYVTYKDISGRKPVEYKENNEAEYNEYMDFVELSDLCFRTSTPYIYGTLSVKVKYNSAFGDYRMVFNRFTLNKMEDNQLIADYSADDYNSALRGIEVQQIKDAKQQEKEAQEQKKKEEKNKKLQEKEQGRQETHKEVQGFLAGIINYWTPNMKQKSGLTFDAYLNPFVEEMVGLDLRAFIGGNGLFYYGCELSVDDFDVKTNLGCLFELGTSVNFGCFRPYGEVFAGFGYITEKKTKSSSDTSLTDVRWGSRCGIDLVISEYSLGAFLNYEGRTSLSKDPTSHHTSIGISIGYLF